jgi:hypothetical protein
MFDSRSHIIADNRGLPSREVFVDYPFDRIRTS